MTLKLARKILRFPEVQPAKRRRWAAASFCTNQTTAICLRRSPAKGLGNQRMNTAHDVDHLSYAETDGDAAQGVSVELREAGASGEEINGVPRCQGHGHV